MPRTAAREATMKLLYEAEMGGPGGDETLEGLLGFVPGKEDVPYIEAVLLAVRDHAPAIDGIIEKHASGWSIERIAKVDLCILRLALAEMTVLRDPGIPTAVSINEAVELSKGFSTLEAGAFINGILGSAARELGI